MELRETVQDGLAVISLGGDVDHGNARLLDDALLALLARGTIQVVVDLQGCSYIDSAGLSVFMTQLNRIGAGGVFAVAGPSDNLRRLFRVVGLTERPGFAIYPNTEAAVAAVLART